MKAQETSERTSRQEAPNKNWEKKERVVPLRSPNEVMRLARLGSFHASRLSFMRSLLRRLKEERWCFELTLWRFDKQAQHNAGGGTSLAQGVEGVAVYRASRKDGEKNKACYSLICFAHAIDKAQRSDRVIAEVWDTTFALYDGIVSDEEIARLSFEVPRQEAGRFRSSELVVSRANKSVRLFEHVAERLAQGLQPDRVSLESVGYLLRTTAVYGNGKFGIADRERIAERSLFRCSFHAELFAVFLFRQFSLDYVEHAARMRAPESAVGLGAEERRLLGIGNATGLGMAPFLVTHPVLLHAWIEARERALSRVRTRGDFSQKSRTVFENALENALRVVGEGLLQEGLQEGAGWQTNDGCYQQKIAGLRSDLAKLREEYGLRTRTRVGAGRGEGGGEDAVSFWDGLFRWGEENLSTEGVELLVSLLLEPQGALVDDLTEGMTEERDAVMTLDGRVSTSEMRAMVEARYGWCCSWGKTGRDYASWKESRYFWYISEEKLEPRLGERAIDEGSPLEQPLTIGWDVARLYEALSEEAIEKSPHMKLGELLLRRPELRFAARRVQLLFDCPYAEIHENLVGSALYPVDLLRCKLSFFGATRFDPRSDRWLRIAMYRGAPEAKGDFSNAEVEEWGLV